MLYFPQTKAYVSQEFPIAAGASVTAEGQALVASSVGGVFGVAPSAGVTGEVFVGIAESQQIQILFAPKVEDLVVPASNTIVLQRTPAAGTLGIYDKTSGAAVASAQITLTGNQVVLGTTPSSLVGHEVIITYRFSPTANEARFIQGDVYPGGAPGNAIGQVGVIRNGTVFTSEFDSSVNWYATNPVVKLGANGLFTIGGSGVTVPGASIISAPSVTYPYLGLLLTQ